MNVLLWFSNAFWIMHNINCFLSHFFAEKGRFKKCIHRFETPCSDYESFEAVHALDGDGANRFIDIIALHNIRPKYLFWLVCIFGFKGASISKVIGARNEMMMDDYDGQMIFGDLVDLKLPDIRLAGEEKPRKTSPRKLVPIGNRTRARCVTSAHATTCSTAVDMLAHLPD